MKIILPMKEKNKNEEYLKNQAVLCEWPYPKCLAAESCEGLCRADCKEGIESFVVHLKDKYNESAISVDTVLEIVWACEKMEIIPELPFGWWEKVAEKYKSDDNYFWKQG